MLLGSRAPLHEGDGLATRAPLRLHDVARVDHQRGLPGPVVHFIQADSLSGGDTRTVQFERQVFDHVGSVLVVLAAVRTNQQMPISTSLLAPVLYGNHTVFERSQAGRISA